MTNKNQSATLPIAHQVGVVPGHDQNHIAVVFDVGSGNLTGAILNEQLLNRLVSLAIAEAGRVAASVRPEPKPSETVSVDPIPVVSVGFGPSGRSDTEMVLLLRTGNLTFPFAIEASTMLDMCSNLKNMTEVAAPRKPH